MAMRLGDPAPDFTAETTIGPLRFRDWKRGSWAILFSHPRDFTPVCTTELGALAKLKPEFDRRNVKVIGLSVDSVYDHRRWARDIAETQNVALNFPLIGDHDRRIAGLYDMIHPQVHDTTTVRSVFVIGPDDRIKLTMTYPATGRRRTLRATALAPRPSRHRHPAAEVLRDPAHIHLGVSRSGL